MKKFLIIILLSIAPLAFPQNKYFIFFRDKGIKPGQSLYKSDQIYQKALNSLSTKSIQRRTKVMGEKIITYEDLPIKEEYIDEVRNEGITIKNKLTWFNAVSAYLTDEQKQVIADLPFVEKIQKVKDLKFKDNSAPIPQSPELNKILDNLNYGISYGQLSLSDVPQVHQKGVTGKNVIIGLLDTGFRWKTHESLENSKVLAEYDFIFQDSVTANQSGDRSSQDSHGTSVFSVIGGHKDGKLYGPAYNATYILAKTEDVRSESHLEEDNYAAALIWMESLGVDITSSSLGYNIFDDTTYSYSYNDLNGKTTIITKAAELAFERGVVVITAAGNEGDLNWGKIIAPADGFNTIAVGAVSYLNIVASFSSRGPTADGRIKPEVVAQGVRVYAADASSYNGYSYENGTSLATPIAGGVAGLLLSAYPYLTNVQIRSILLETAGNSENPDNYRGYGLISAARAISYPNLQEENNSYTLHKAFIGAESIVPSSVQLHYSDNGINFSAASLIYDDSLAFTYGFPLLQINKNIEFYYTYKDSSGNNHRDPLAKNYNFESGSKIIALNINSKSRDVNFVLGKNYPNPFSKNTKIDFISNANEKAELIILSSIGEKVKTLFNGISSIGINTIVWDGKNDNGINVASGVYYYLLNLGGKQYGGKMVLVK